MKELIDGNEGNAQKMNIHLYSRITLAANLFVFTCCGGDYSQYCRKMYDVCHPAYYKICELGCKDDVKITTAFHVYIELCEERKLWDVEYKYESSLDLIYLEAKKNKHSQTEFYIPWAIKYNMKLQDIENIQKHLNVERFTLVSKSGDGASMFHTINSGLIKPLEPHEHNDVRLLSKKRMELSRELRKNSRNLYDMAKLSAEDPQSQATSE